MGKYVSFCIVYLKTEFINVLLSISSRQPITLVEDFNTVLPRSIYSNIVNFLSKIFLVLFLIRFRINLLKQLKKMFSVCINAFLQTLLAIIFWYVCPTAFARSCNRFNNGWLKLI